MVDFSQRELRAAFEKKLAAFAPASTIVWPNSTVGSVEGVLYYQAFLIPGTPENPTVGTGFHRQLGIFQVNIAVPTGTDTGDADDLASNLAFFFRRGTLLVENSLEVIISNTPNILTGFDEDDRWKVPVQIPYFCNVIEGN